VSEDRLRQTGWGTYVALVLVLVVLVLFSLFFLRSGTRGLFSDAASSVSNAPGP
jgi:hypothetical protein